jgi:5-methylcytosine-specific restriction protein A
MPTAPPRFSIGPKQHRKPWQNDSVRKLTGRALQRERRKLFAREPLCRECAKEGRTTIATIRDHILALAFGGKDESANTQPLCQSCSDAKTKRESADGARMARATGG